MRVAGLASRCLKDYPIGYLHVGFAEVQTEAGCQYLFGAIDRTSKVAAADRQPQATKLAAAFLRRVLAKLPYRVQPVPTDNGLEFGNMRHQPWALRHLFGRVCPAHGIEHRFTKPGYP